MTGPPPTTSGAFTALTVTTPIQAPCVSQQVSGALTSLATLTTASPRTIQLDSTGGAFVLNLPNVELCDGEIFNFANNGSANSVTLTAQGTQNIQNGATLANTSAIAGPSRMSLQAVRAERKWLRVG